jgi:hypothetical protein
VGAGKSTQGSLAAPARWTRAVAAAAVLTAVSVGAPSAGNAATNAPAAASRAADLQPTVAGSSPAELARLEARAARLARQYRGQLIQLTAW